MNLMERNLQTIQLFRPGEPGRNADAPAGEAQAAAIRAALCPCERTALREPYGLATEGETQLLYAGGERLEPGMAAVAADGTRYRLESVWRYPWLQTASLREEAPA